MNSISKLGLVALLAVGLAGAGSALADDDESGVKERPVKLEDVPDAVRETILREADGREILEVEETVRGDVTHYEAGWRDGEMEVEIAVASDGKLLERETEKLASSGDDGKEDGESGGDDDGKGDDENDGDDGTDDD